MVSTNNKDIWIPKDMLTQMSSQGSVNVVLIRAKRATSKVYKDWIVPNNLISAQGYYEGQTQLWVPKNAIHNQGGSSSQPRIRRPQQSNQVIQQRLVKENASISNNWAIPSPTQSKTQRWVPKKSQETHTKQAATDKQEQVWVPKRIVTTKELQTSSRASTSSSGKQGIPTQCSTDTRPKGKNAQTKEDAPIQVLSSPFFMAINPIYDPSPIQDMDQIVEEILCQWGLQ